MQRPRFRDALHQQIEEFRKEQEQSVIREFVEEEIDDDASDLPLYDGAVVQITDRQPSEEWKRDAEARRLACCYQSQKPDQAQEPDPNRTLYSYIGKDGLACPIISTKGCARY